MEIVEAFRYNRWANQTLLEALATLTPEQLHHRFGEPMGSIQEQVAHLLQVPDRYLARLTESPVPDFALETLSDVPSLLAYHEEVADRWDAYLVGLTPAQSQATLRLETRRGVFVSTVAQTLFHVVNHSTYHRGQIATMLKCLSVDFPDTDHIIWANLP